jgi:leucyl aminopeptidase
VVLIGKGITFDTGGLSIKPIEAMRLMRKDMGGAAAVVGAVFAAAALRLPVRVTALAPLAENAVSGSAYRPGDVVRHYGGATTEVLNTDAEGRIVLADALAYADRALAPDVVIDLATLTGAQSIALGKRTAALFSENDALADGLLAAAAQAGEKVWRLPLHDDYLEALASDVADLVNVTEIGAGAVMAALYLREFTGGARGRWAHLDMSSCAWSDGAEAELVKGATGWGVRTLVCWLRSQAAGGAACPDAALAATAAARLDPAGQRPAAGPGTATHSVTPTPDAMLAEGGLVTLGEHGRDTEAAGAYDVAVEHGADAGLASEG